MIEYLQNVFGNLVAAVGTVVVAGGGLSVLTYAMFRFFGERWLNAKFEERLAAYRHTQQKELEHLRFEINALMDRTIKLHQREFEVLPEAWSLFNDAYFEVNRFMGFRSFPDLNKMPENQLDEFLKNSAMQQWQKDELKTKSDKLRYYMEYASWQEVVQARKVYNVWQIYFLKNGIFMTKEIQGKFLEISDLLRGALVENQMRNENREDMKLSEMTDFRRLMKEGSKLREGLEADVHARLWNSTVGGNKE